VTQWSLVNGDGARELKTKRPGDEAAPEQAAMGPMCNCTHTRGKEKKLETMAITFGALERELKYIQALCTYTSGIV